MMRTVCRHLEGFAHTLVMPAMEPIGLSVDDVGITLDVNGVRRQSGNRNQMIWKTVEAISLLSGLLELRSGDILFNGTQAASHVGID